MDGQSQIVIEGVNHTYRPARGRTVLYLEYEAFEEMAEPMLRALADELTARHSLSEVAIHHRVGRGEIRQKRQGSRELGVLPGRRGEHCRKPVVQGRLATVGDPVRGALGSVVGPLGRDHLREAVGGLKEEVSRFKVDYVPLTRPPG